MATRDQIRAAILEVTGNPDTGIVHAITPALIDTIDRLCNGTPETKTKTKPNQETRLMGGVENTRGETA